MPADPVLSQLEEPALRGEDFRTENVPRVDSLIDDDHILIDGRNQPLELYHLFNDPLQQHNLAELPSERTGTARLKQTLDGLRSGLGGTARAAAALIKWAELLTVRHVDKHLLCFRPWVHIISATIMHRQRGRGTFRCPSIAASRASLRTRGETSAVLCLSP